MHRASAPDLPAAGGGSSREELPGRRDIPGALSEIELSVCLGEEDGAASRADDWHLIRRLDLFVFDDDPLRALDSYTRSYAYSPQVVSVPSGSGDKIVVVFANLDLDDALSGTIRCYDDLWKVVTELTGDDPSQPVMSGQTGFVAGQGHSCRVTLEPMMSLVEVRSLVCRPSETYAGESLQQVKVYLTGISNRAQLLRTEGFLPSETLNNGALSEADLGRLPYSGMVYRYLGDGRAQSGERSYGSAALYCYPNESAEDTPGSPFTRLVVEGQWEGRTCYYAFPINRGASGDGIARNHRYVFDLTLTRPGTESPDEVLPATP